MRIFTFGTILFLCIQFNLFSQINLTENWRLTAGTVSFLPIEGDHYRGIVYNPLTNHLLVASRAPGHSGIHILDADSGDSLGTLDMTGISGGFFAFNRVRIAADGVIYTSNMTTDGQDLKVYRWIDETLSPELILHGTYIDPPARPRLGDTFSVYYNEGFIDLIIGGTTSNLYSFSGYGETIHDEYPQIRYISPRRSNTGISHINYGDDFFYTGYSSHHPVYIDCWKCNFETDFIPLDVIGNSIGAVKYFSANNRHFVAASPVSDEYLVNMADGLQIAEFNLPYAPYKNEDPFWRIYEQYGLWGDEPNENPNATGDIAVRVNNNNTVTLFVLTGNNGIISFTSDILSSTDDKLSLPGSFHLSQNYPNPFNPVTTIEYSVAYQSHIKITVYDIIGREVQSLVDDYKNAGSHSVVFDAHSMPSGVYIYKMKTNAGIQTRRMTLIR